MGDSVPAGHLEREARILGRYLAGGTIPTHIVARYADHIGAARSPGQDSLDRTLLRVAVMGGAFAAMADAYGRWFRPAGALRARLTILCALIESSQPYHSTLGMPREGSRWGGMVEVLISAWLGALTLAGAVLLLGPVHVGLRARRDGPKQ